MEAVVRELQSDGTRLHGAPDSLHPVLMLLLNVCADLQRSWVYS
jgi:hypothetical protein